MKRVLLALLVLASVAGAPVLAATATATPSDTSQAGSGVSAPLAPSGQSFDPNNTTTTTPPPTTERPAENDSDSDRPGVADSVRILPVSLDSDVQSTTVSEQGEVYNTSGPFAFFSISEEVEQVAIQQSGAEASVLAGGRQVRVQYDDDAAPVGKQSLYELQLWFSDGSTKTIDLYAERTSISTGAANMKKYRPVIQTVLSDAEEAGYERSPDGMEAFYTATKEKAELLDHLLTKQAARLFASLLSIVMNPLGIVLLLASAALLAVWLLKRNKQVLEILSNSTGKAEQLRERLWIEYKAQQQTAADEHLRELDGVKEMGEIYWDDSFGVNTTAGLAELFRRGVPVRRDGEIQMVGGVETLEPESIESSWLEAVCRKNRIASPELALSHGKTALHRMISKYGMGHKYEDAYRRTIELIDELDESNDLSPYSGETTSDTDAAPSGGPAVGGAS